jgi:hypothetical protein
VDDVRNIDYGAVADAVERTSKFVDRAGENEIITRLNQVDEKIGRIKAARAKAEQGTRQQLDETDVQIEALQSRHQQLMDDMRSIDADAVTEVVDHNGKPVNQIADKIVNVRLSRLEGKGGRMNRALDEATQGSGLFEDRFQKIEYLATWMDRDVGKRLISIEGETAGWHKTMHTVANEAAKKRVAQEDDRVTESCAKCAHTTMNAFNRLMRPVKRIPQA